MGCEARAVGRSAGEHEGRVELERFSKPKLMNMIDAFRAEKCAGMKDEHGKTFQSFDQCYEFMYDKCHPGKDKEMDGGKKEVTTKQGFCSEYFPEDESKEQKEA